MNKTANLYCEKGVVLIPAYNEEKTIATVLNKIHCFNKDIDICVINDCSSDDTVESIKKSNTPRVVIISHVLRQGYGVAIQTGYKYALKQGYDFAIQIDADGQHDPAYIPDFIRSYQYNPVDVIIGSRFIQKKDQLASIGFFKYFAINLFRVLIKLITGYRITDPTSGYQMINRRALLFFSQDFFPYDYPDANLICYALKNNLRYREISVEMCQRAFGESMHNGIIKHFYYMYKVSLLSLLAIFIRPRAARY